MKLIYFSLDSCGESGEEDEDDCWEYCSDDDDDEEWEYYYEDTDLGNK